MSRVIIFLFLTLSITLTADTYNDALKLAASGDSIKSLELFHDYFKNNINDVNQDGIIEKLLYSSSLLDSVDSSLEFMLEYVKYMKSPTSRFRIYKKIAEIYELTGDIHNSGIYYEKAAYTNKDYIDYDSLANSIEMLMELGYYELSIDKLKDVISKVEDVKIKDRCHFILSRAYSLTDNETAAINELKMVSSTNPLLDFYRYELGLELNLEKENLNNFEKIILDFPDKKLKTPTDYVGKSSELNKINDYELIKNSFSSEKEIYIGKFINIDDAAGIINILNQLGLPWFFDKYNEEYDLYTFSENIDETVSKLTELGIRIK